MSQTVLKLLLTAGLVTVAAVAAASAQPPAPDAAPAAPAAGGVAGFTAAQSQAGVSLYRDNCEQCHGANLDDGQFAPSLKGANFKDKWSGKPAAELYDYVAANMPPGQAGALGGDAYAAILAHILEGNGVAAGDKPLPFDGPSLKALNTP